MLLAHLSDLHLDGAPRTAERARRVVRFLEAFSESIDVVIVTGDIAEHGLDSEYAQARGLLCGLPRVVVGPGNHDDRAAFRRTLLRAPAGTGPINQIRSLDGLVIAMCDSTIPGRADGRLDDETIAWLDRALSAVPDGVPVIAAFHHPPIRLHNPLVDAIRQFGEHRLAEVIERHSGVVAILCGHAHTPAVSSFAGRPLLVAPGVASSLRLPWERVGDLDQAMPPGLAFHVLGDDGSFTTHFRVLP